MKYFVSLKDIAPRIAKNIKDQKLKIDAIKFLTIDKMYGLGVLTKVYTLDNMEDIFVNLNDFKSLCDEFDKRGVSGRSVLKNSVDDIEFGAGGVDVRNFLINGSNGLKILSENDGDFLEYKLVNSGSIDDVKRSHYKYSSWGAKQSKLDEDREDRKENKKQALQKEIDDKNDLSFRLFDKISNLDFDIKQEAVAIDFEFFKKKNGDYLVSEAGISYFDQNGKLVSHHFIVDKIADLKRDKSLQGSFNFGVSKICKNHYELRSELINVVKYFKTIIIHESREDVAILKQLKINLDYKRIVDTQESYKRYLRLKGSDSRSVSLKELLSKLGIGGNDSDVNNLHNAGNDAYYTLSVAQAMKEFVLSRSKVCSESRETYSGKTRVIIKKGGERVYMKNGKR